MNLKNRLQNNKFRSKVLIATGVIIMIFAASFTLFINPLLKKDKYIYKEAKVAYGDLVLGIQESGSVDLNVKDVSYEIVLETEEDDEGEDEDDEDETEKNLTVEEVYVASGERIKEGGKLFKLTSDSVTAVKKQLESIKTEAEITLEEAKAEYNISILSAKSTSESSAIDSKYADSIYLAQTSSISNEIKKSTEDITVLQGEIEQLKEDLADDDLWTSYKEAKTELTAAQNTLNDTSINNPAGYTTNYATYTKAKSAYDLIQSQIDEINQSIDSKQKEIIEKQAEISQKQKQFTSENLNAKQSQETAKLSGETAEDIYGYTVNSLKGSVTSAENTLSEAEENLNDFTDFVGDDGIIYAPESGIVTAVNYAVGDEIISTGSLLSYSTGTQNLISVDVAEEDVPYINVGDTVSINFTAYKDEEYTGTISGIETTKTDNHETTVNYPVTIQIEGDTTLLYGGMIADVTFKRETFNYFLYVSKKAIIENDDGTTYVYYRNAIGKMKLLPVEVGFTDGVNVEIKSGLSEGDTIYIASKVSAENANTLESN